MCRQTRYPACGVVTREDSADRPTQPPGEADAATAAFEAEIRRYGEFRARLLQLERIAEWLMK